MRIIKIFLLIAAASLSTALWATPVVVGTEFRVNTYTAGNQSSPSVATDSAGNFVVVWASSGQDGSGLGVFARRYDETGSPLGGEFQVNTYTTGDQGSPVVAMDGSGGFVVAWIAPEQDGSGTGILGRRFSAAGTAIGGEFRINAQTANDQFGPAVSMNDSGDFVVVWSTLGAGSWGFDNHGQRFDAIGAPVGSEFLINTFTVWWQSDADVAMNDTGEFVVAWRSWYLDGSRYGVAGRRFDSVGIPVSDEVQVNLYTADDQANPSVGIDASGNVVVVWQSTGQDGFGRAVCERHFDSSGHGSAESYMHAYKSGDQSLPEISLVRDDNFLVVWQSQGQDGSDFGIYAQNWDTPGNEFRINTYTTGAQTEPAVAVSESGKIVVVWQSSGQDGSGTGIYAQRYTCHDLDGDGLCDFADVLLESPANGATLSCLNPQTTRPTIEWDPGDYDRFRVYMSADPTFSQSSAQVTSGDTLLRSSFWTPTTKKWRSACRKALAVNPFSPEIYIRVLGVDREMPKGDPSRKTYSQFIHAHLQM